ncbi:MAG: acetylglutamate kinase [uncultured archaeon A07HR60]|nr:MAG: acetylglutamate kinase [uncultured archaeon A07HR60]
MSDGLDGSDGQNDQKTGNLASVEADGADPVVVKIGGARAVDPAGAIGDIAHLSEHDRDIVVVHGGSSAVDETLDRLGKSPEYVETPDGVVGRFTDAETMDVFEMVLPGRVNTDLTAELQDAGVDAVGLSGVDGGLLSGPRKPAVRVQDGAKQKIKRGDHSGKIEAVADGLLWTLLDAGYAPVISPPMLGEESDGTTIPVNADADRAAAAVAGALGAELILLTDVEGVYADPEKSETIIGSVTQSEEMEVLETAAEGFMTRKVMAAREALTIGAPAVTVSTANRSDPVIDALDGAGTRIHREAVAGEDAPSDTDSPRGGNR